MRRPEEAKNLCGEKSRPPDSDPLATPSLAKITTASQYNSVQRGSRTPLCTRCHPIIKT